MESPGLFQNKKLIQIGISAMLAVFFVRFYLKSQEDRIQDSYGMVEVLVASRDIPPRTLLNPGYLTIERVPRKFVQPGAVLVKIPEQALERVRGKLTVAGVPARAQLLMANLIDPKVTEGGVAPVIPPHHRGFLLRLGNTDVADLILPGDHIDVLATFTIRRPEGTTKKTYTILQNVLILSVGKIIKRPDQGATNKKDVMEGLNLMLAVTVHEAEQLALAQSESQGEITITVRPPGEEDTTTTAGVAPAHPRVGR
jgi:Flp pilus assembly protein CpaB